MKDEQIFFRADERDEAMCRVLNGPWDCLYEVIDRRSKKPKPRMFIFGRANMLQFEQSGMMKRMWIIRRIGHVPINPNKFTFDGKEFKVNHDDIAAGKE